MKYIISEELLESIRSATSTDDVNRSVSNMVIETNAGTPEETENGKKLLGLLDRTIEALDHIRCGAEGNCGLHHEHGDCGDDKCRFRLDNPALVKNDSFGCGLSSYMFHLEREATRIEKRLRS